MTWPRSHDNYDNTTQHDQNGAEFESAFAFAFDFAFHTNTNTDSKTDTDGAIEAGAWIRNCEDCPSRVRRTSSARRPEWADGGGNSTLLCGHLTDYLPTFSWVLNILD